MNDLDFILNWTEELKQEIQTFEFERNDLRTSFLLLTYDISYCYYRGYMILTLADFINDEKIVFARSLTNYENHIKRLAETTKLPPLKVSYTNHLNRNFFIDTFSAFELSVTDLCKEVSNQEELKKLLEFHHSEIVKIIKSKIQENEINKIRDKTVKEHLTHVPITRKTDFLFNKVKGYSRNKEKDREYLKFLGKLRNTIHSNYIYQGNDYEYNFGQAHFIFKNNERVVWSDPFEDTPKLLLYIIGELKQIWKELSTTITMTSQTAKIKL